MADLIGKTVGQYKILDRLGRGGMATVFKGYHAALDRYVAIKVLDPTISSDETFLARFQREARAVATLRHPHIVQVHDFGNVDDMYYMVMEYVDGETLRERLKTVEEKGEFLPVEEMLTIAKSIAGALDYAHNRGIVHRDVKSSNILLSSDGQAVLSDFGIAQMVETSRLTISGLVGTPSYMSPEQGQGLPVDHRTDIYSLGVVVYEMLTCRVPFTSDTPLGVVMQHISRPIPSLKQFRPDIPSSIEEVIAKATAKEREQRYNRAIELARALEGVYQLTAMGIPAIAPLPSQCPHCQAPLEPEQQFCTKCGKLVVPAETAAAGETMLEASIPPKEAEIGGTLMDMKLPGPTPTIKTVPLSPPMTPPPGKLTRPYPSDAVTPLPGHHAVARPVVKPQGGLPWMMIGMGLAGVAILLALAIVAVVFLFPQKDDHLVAGQPTATVNRSAVTQSTATPAKGVVQQVPTPTAVPTESPTDAAVPPTPEPPPPLPPEPIATDTPAPELIPTDTPVIVPDTPTPLVARPPLVQPTPLVARPPLVQPTNTLGSSAPGADGQLVIATPTDTSLSNIPGIVPIDTPTRKPVTPKPPPATKGRIMFRSDRGGKEALYIMNADGSSPAPLSDESVYKQAMDRETLSPDGKERLRVMDNSGNWDIYIGPADEHQPPMHITSDSAADYDPAWSPKGDQIAFVSLRNDRRDAIFVMSPDGRNDRQLTFNKPALDKHPSWSSDGTRIVFGSDRDGGRRQIYVMAADGSGQRNISNNKWNDWDPIWLK